ncbi:MAG: hypothetical protein NT062_09995, partial [Proteobacteria bacterium]|nr:hypothetical protein [Pseudomonadota bacterium]
LWVVSPNRLTRLSLPDGAQQSSEPLDYLEPSGRFLISSTAPTLPVWHGLQPVLVRANPARIEVPGPGGELIFPIAEGRWLLWQGGQLRLWRTIGESWRRSIGDPGSRAIDAQLVLDGRLFVLAQQRAAHDGAELRLTVVQVSDGAQNTQIRLPGVTQLAIAARRGLALARSGDRLSVIDLRFGRWIRDLQLPDGVTEIAVDDALQVIALGSADGLELVRPDSLAPHAPPNDDTRGTVDARVTERLTEEATRANGHDVGIATEDAPPETATPPGEAFEPFPDEPLVRLDPVTDTATASARQIATSVELMLELVGARTHVAIAQAWDNGRISKPDPMKPPFADEVGGLLQIASGRYPNEIADAADRWRTLEDEVHHAELERAGNLTPLDVLARDFGLSPLATTLLFAIAAPRMRGELARIYGILANDPGRPVVDEYLLGQIYGADEIPAIARELDGDHPLRRLGLVRVSGDRPFAALVVDPLVIRYIANQSPDGEPDQFLVVRRVDRDLDELHMPRPLIARALRFLAAERDRDPVRIAIRGRTGSGRHTLLVSLAARAGRAVGIIDVTLVPRENKQLPGVLEAVLRRALLRGLIPCVDGLEIISSAEDPDTKLQVAQVLRAHPGPLALRLPTDAPIPLDPGYLTLDVPMRNEQQRGESWGVALERHVIELSDSSDLASRYRVGPGIIERVCADVSRRPDRPTTPAEWVKQ